MFCQPHKTSYYTRARACRNATNATAHAAICKLYYLYMVNTIKTKKSSNVSVGLKQFDIAMVEDTALELGISKNAYLAWCIRYCNLQFKRGKLPIKEHLQKTVEISLKDPE